MYLAPIKILMYNKSPNIIIKKRQFETDNILYILLLEF